MITFCIVVLLVSACHCQSSDNSTDGSPSELASVQGLTESTVIATDPTSAPEGAESSTTNLTDPAAAQRVPEDPTTATPPARIPPVISLNGQGVPPEDCSIYSPGDNATSFKVLSGGVTFDFNCVHPLIWSQQNCRCEEVQPLTTFDQECAGHRAIPGKPRQFQKKRENGEWEETPFNCPELLIWDQDMCRCEWGPGEPRASGGLTAIQRALASGCLVLFNATFDKDIVDDSEAKRAVGRQPWPAVTPETSVAGANGGAARVKAGQLILWFTGSNDLGRKLQIQIRFQVLNTGPDSRERTLLSNSGCDSGARNIDIKYRPSDQTYTVIIRTVGRLHTYSCKTNHLDAYAFHYFDLLLYNNVLSLYVDDSECFTETSIQTGLRPTACYIGVGGSDFDGYIDEVVFRRGCFVKDHRSSDPL